jgi:hypothetical protein
MTPIRGGASIGAISLSEGVGGALWRYDPRRPIKAGDEA